MGKKENNNKDRDKSIGALSKEDNNDDELVCKKTKMVNKKLELDSVKEVSAQPKGKKRVLY